VIRGYPGSGSMAYWTPNFIFVKITKNFQRVESYFGSSVSSFFILLRWLCYLNIIIAVIIVAFVTVRVSQDFENYKDAAASSDYSKFWVNITWTPTLRGPNWTIFTKIINWDFLVEKHLWENNRLNTRTARTNWSHNVYMYINYINNDPWSKFLVPTWMVIHFTFFQPFLTYHAWSRDMVATSKIGLIHPFFAQFYPYINFLLKILIPDLILFTTNYETCEYPC